MTVELPKDAKGREIPLDVEVLYNANGESVKPYSFTFRRYDGFCWEMRLVGAPEDLVYETNSFYLTPPDSWERLEEDLDECIETDDSCRYYSTSGICAKCTRPDNDGDGCTTVIFSDIKKRIRKLRGESDA